MRPATLLLVTWLIWITAKGRLSQYWQLATVSNRAPQSPVGPGAASSAAMSPTAPGNPLPVLPSLGG